MRLLTLAAKGLIETRKRAGTRVRASSDWNRLDAQVLGWMGEIEPDLDFVRGLIEARLVIEPAAAATRRQHGDLRRSRGHRGCLRCHVQRAGG